VTTLTVLQGWLKVQPAPSDTVGKLAINAGNLRLDVSRSASVMHVGPARVEVFVERGTQHVEELDRRGRPGRVSVLSHEQYSLRKADEPLQPAARPPASFISAMPDAFFDSLVLLSGKPLTDVPPKKIRDVNFEDVAHWLRAPGMNRATMASQFAPRLQTPAFRKAIIREMGGSFEWESALYRVESKSRTLDKSASKVGAGKVHPPKGT
jgi:hypothetical protein